MPREEVSNANTVIQENMQADGFRGCGKRPPSIGMESDPQRADGEDPISTTLWSYSNAL